MKKTSLLLSFILIIVVSSGFTAFNSANSDDSSFNLDDLYDYQKKYETEEIEVCASTTAKTYMDYRMTTVVSSKQYQFIRNNLIVDKKTGFLYDEDGFIAVALGSFYGEIGDRFYFTLQSGVVLPLVKAEEKAEVDTDTMGCYHRVDSSVIEFVIDEDYAANYFYYGGNGLVLNGNYNNYGLFRGEIIKAEKVLDELNQKYVNYKVEATTPSKFDIFNYASGY